MKYKLIIDSGSTKTDWVIVTGNQNLKFSTSGINPSADANIYNLKIEGDEIIQLGSSIDEIHYFGAGVIDDSTREIVKKWLKQYFKNVRSFEIESDMLGCAKATSGDKKGIINILGTGSNSCVYNGSEIVDNIPALGYSLSNEGGGSKIGGELIKAYFYGLLPKNIKSEFEKKYSLTKSELIEHLYKRDNPTAYLAKFAKFLNETEDKQWRREFLFPLFQEYIDLRIKQYSEYLQYDLHFVGSIAYFYSDILRDVLQHNNLTCSSIIRKPIDGLVDYFK